MLEMVSNRQLIFGEGALSKLSPLLLWQQIKKAFIVTFDRQAPCFLGLLNELEQNGISYYVYSDVHGEPDLDCINNGRDIFLKQGCDCTIAFGGGSIIDTAKAINMLAVNGGMIEEYQMDGKQVTTPPPFFAAIPTTSGTGAEATKTSVVFNNHNGLKKSLYHTSMIADLVILDPSVTTNLPAHITAATGMDALSHAIEAYVSLNASPLTEMYSLKAVELISQSLSKAVHNPSDIESRGNMMLASYFGGVAITAGIGIAHIMAQPLGGLFKIPHGDACSIFLPASIELNKAFSKERYARLAQAFGLPKAGSDDEAVHQLICAIQQLQREIQAPVSLRPYISEELSDDRLLDIVKRTTGHITCNPRPLDEELILTAYRMVC